MTSISQGFGDVRSRMPWWILGGIVLADGSDEKGDGINAYPQAKQVTTVTVANPAADVAVSLVINGVTITYQTVGDLTAAQLGAALAIAINAEPLVRGQVVATFDTVTLTLTAVTPGVVFTVTESDANLSAVTTTTAAAAAAVIEFGRAVCHQGWQDTDRLIMKAASTPFTAQVITTSIAYVSGAVISIRVYEVRGAERVLIASVDEVSATDRDTTVDALVALVNTALPAASVDAAADAGTATAIVWTAEVAGLEFDVEIEAGYEGATLPAVSNTYTTGPSVSTSFHRAFLGITLRDQGVGAITIGGAEQQYAANSVCGYLKRGRIAVECAESPVTSDQVYVELGVTADNGKFFAADNATRIAVSRRVAQWYLDANTATGSLAALRLL